MAYTLTAEQVCSVTDVEQAFGTMRLLPDWDDIPKDFKEGNCYTATVEAIFCGTELPKGTIELIDNVSPAALNKCVRAHLQSFGPKHEHKIAGVAYLMSCSSTFDPENEAAGA
ncbi:hypothetical protein [Stutzerimonas stutzeri]|uniref:hypothetical protein n=1 Tax=Stutzerimonas stutzeri TaxID=316 RepID=UPI001BCD9DFC|nr:hypothetical protein [Stutzerimonas stutzeri]